MRGPLIGRKDFQLPLDKVNNFKEGSWKRTKERKEYLVFCGKKRRRRKAWKRD
jgi:hypothetical protein